MVSQNIETIEALSPMRFKIQKKNNKFDAESRWNPFQKSKIDGAFDIEISTFLVFWFQNFYFDRNFCD